MKQSIGKRTVNIEIVPADGRGKSLSTNSFFAI